LWGEDAPCGFQETAYALELSGRTKSRSALQFFTHPVNNSNHGLLRGTLMLRNKRKYFPLKIFSPKKKLSVF
jgi:hypothetical protein